MLQWSFIFGHLNTAYAIITIDVCLLKHWWYIYASSDITCLQGLRHHMSNSTPIKDERKRVLEMLKFFAIIAGLFIILLTASCTLNEEPIPIVAPDPPPPKWYYIELNVNHSAFGAVEGGGEYEEGTFIQVQATPSKGYTFLGWYENDALVTSDTSYGFTVEREQQLKARFQLLPLDQIDGYHIKDGDYLYALVSKSTYLGRYEPTDLVALPLNLSSRQMTLRQEALDHLIEMADDAATDGVRLIVVSAYRSYETQETIFARNVARAGAEEANRFSARPGQSEHQLGTAIDFGGTNADFDAAYGETAAGQWLFAHAHHYGFIMSYPKDSEHITGYIYEPWHFRYIGQEAAQEWKESDLTLVEFLMTKPQYFK